MEESDVGGREEAAVDGLLLLLLGVGGLLIVARWLTVPLGVRRLLVLERVRLVDRAIEV